MTIQAEDYSALVPSTPANAAMAKLRALVEEYQKVCEFLHKYEELVERGKKREKELREELIPQVCEVDCGQSMCGYPDGLKVEVKTDYYANIPAQSTIDKMKDPDEAARLQERLDTAMEWLEANAPTVIKRKFDITFGREDEAWAAKFERDLKQRKKPLNYQRSCTVHPQTLNALVRQLIDQDFQVPRETLGVYERKVAKITLPK